MIIKQYEKIKQKEKRLSYIKKTQNKKIKNIYKKK